MSVVNLTNGAVDKLVQHRTDLRIALLHDPKPVVDEAISRKLLNREDCDRINSESTNANVIRECLNTVEGKGEDCAKSFLKILHDLRGRYPPLRSWIEDYADTSVLEAQINLQDFSNVQLLFLLRMEKSSLAKRLWKDFPRLCEEARKASLLPQCFAATEVFNNFTKMKNSNSCVDCLLNVILEGGVENVSSFWWMLKNDESTRDVVRQTIDKLQDSKMEKMLQAYGDAQDALKKELRKNFGTIKDYNAPPCGRTKFEHRFVEPVIVKWKPGIDDVPEEHEMIKLCREHRLKNIADDRLTRDAIFERQDLFVDCENDVVVCGAPGVGKTIFSQKLVYDWASGDCTLNKRFDFVLLLKCRNLNHICSLTTLRDIVLNEFPCLEEVVDDLLKNGFRLLMILDALDEMKHPLDFDNVCRSPRQPHDLGGIVAGLLNDTLLKGGTVLVTTRIVGLEWMNHVDHHLHAVEIVGFSEKETRQFFEKFYNNEEIAKQVFHHLSANDVLSSLCFNPTFCWITATCLGKYFTHNDGKMSDVAPKTMTELFSQYILLHLEHHGGKTVSSSPDTLLGLCQLAFHGVKEKKILFTAEDLSEHGVTETCQTFFSEVFLRSEVQCICHYEFFHQTVQEYFAALYFFLPQPNNVQGFMENRLNSVFEKPGDKDDNRYHIFQRFLSGLLAEKPRHSLKRCSISLTNTPKVKVHSWLKQHKLKDLNCFHCVYELQDTNFVNSLMEDVDLGELTERMTSPMDCTVLVYALQTSNKQMNSWQVNLGLNDPSQRMRILAPAFPLFEKLQFRRQIVGDDGMKIMVDALANKPNHLREMTLENCQLSAISGPALRNLINNSHLEVLELRLNSIRDEGLEGLADGLMPEAKLRNLQLLDCDLSANSVPALTSIINHSNLEVLDLICNDVGDEGLEMLANGLKPHAKLRELRLFRCNLSANAGPPLKKIMKKSNLEILHLDENRIGDQGLGSLAESLVPPETLKELRLDYCSLTDEALPILFRISCVPSIKQIM
uniref:Uncharacterized protein n=1 Tax=Eptatretus burgeri TaxID=7764 RepID=A0A8C4QYZ5_EPTBU